MNLNNKPNEYNAELQHAMNELKSILSQAQVVIGVVETCLYFLKKESNKEIEIVANGVK